MNLFIFKIDDSKYEELLSDLTAYLDIKELNSVNQFKFVKGKAVKCISILLTKYIMINHFNLMEYKLGLKVNGKPYILNDDQHYFNISHSGNYIICGTSDSEIGVDVEEIKGMRDILDIAKRFFSKDEFFYLNSIAGKSDLINEFYSIWTKKESFIKAEGSGLSLGLGNFNVPIDIDKCNWIKYSNEKWFFSRVSNFSEKFAVSICEKNKCSDKICIINLSINDLKIK